jgi:hypothetical protein
MDMAIVVVEDAVAHGRKLLIDENKPKEAADYFNFLFNNDPENSIYPYYLGCCYQKLDLDGLAVACFKDCLSKDPDFPEAWSNMGFVYFKMQEKYIARNCWEHAVMIGDTEKYAKTRQTDFVREQRSEFLVNLATTYIAEGTPETAIKLLDKAIEIDDNANAHWNKGLALLEMGKYQEGWPEYDQGERNDLAHQRCYNNLQDPKTPLWDGTPGQTVVVYGEQGIGDEIMFASMIPDLAKDCKVIIDAHPRLADIFRGSFPGMPIYGTRKDKQVVWAGWSTVDAKISLGSLGRYYRNKAEDFPGTPYITPDPKLVAHYGEQLRLLSDKPKIGISWKGGIKKTGKNQRIIPMDKLRQLFDLDADFISLQYDENAQHEVDKFNESTDLTIHHWPFAIAHYDHTAALIKNLDFIISVPQSVVHLAGAIGVPTIQLCPKRALWQMGVYGQNMPWYNSVINIWQTEAGDWDDCLERALEMLKKLLTTKDEQDVTDRSSSELELDQQRICEPEQTVTPG